MYRSNRREMTDKPKPTRTTNPLHFEDLEPHRFEDLIRQLASDFRSWVKLEPTGILGSDEGYDARGVDVVDGEKRFWQIQSKREQSITPKKMSAYIQEMIPDGATVPHGVILAAPANFSKRARDVFALETRTQGCPRILSLGKSRH